MKILSRTPILVAGSVGLAMSGMAVAAEMPELVSPGEIPGRAVFEERCPTFSWSGVAEATDYELVVYRVRGGDPEEQPVVRKELPGSSRAWTPSTIECLDPESSYAWSVRAMNGTGLTEWARPVLFEIVSPPSSSEVTAAVETLHRYLAAVDPERVSSKPLGDPPVSERSDADTGPGTFTSDSHGGTGGAIMVDGVVAETKADPPCYPAAASTDAEDRFIDCGNGTVLDTVSGLLWLKDANCPGGTRTWWQAVEFPSTLADGSCGLSDHSQAGDWRLPTEEEWDGVRNPDPACGFTRLAGKAGGCYAGDPWASNLTGPAYWSSTTLADSPDNARYLNLTTGTVLSAGKSGNQYLWPVRDGN